MLPVPTDGNYISSESSDEREDQLVLNNINADLQSKKDFEQRDCIPETKDEKEHDYNGNANLTTSVFERKLLMLLMLPMLMMIIFVYLFYRCCRAIHSPR